MQKGGQNEECIGLSKGGLTTKIHGTWDGLGNPTGFHLTPGQACDLDGDDVLLPHIHSYTLLADKDVAHERVLSHLKNRGKRAIIPPKSHRKIQGEYKDLYSRLI